LVSKCKSYLSDLARRCVRGHSYWRAKFQQAQQLVDKLCAEAARGEARRAELERENRRWRERVEELAAQLAQPRAVKLPVGDAPAGQQYGAGLITLCVNLASQIGLRPTERALRVVFEWLQAGERIPKYQSIRGWMQRIGLDRQERAPRTSGGVWLTDHTNQIGTDKVLTVLRVHDSHWPSSGVALRHQDVEVLAVVPGQTWTNDDVGKVYQKTAQRCGTPRAIVSDGAEVLREPAKTLGKTGEKPVAIRDLKHFLANQLEALLTRDPSYQAFAQQLSGTRTALKQTELAHFIPPGFKRNSRFMNLAPTLAWASTILWHLGHPQSHSRAGVTDRRMTEKLGWLRNFAADIRQWQACQKVISASLTFINQQGLFAGAAKQVRQLVADLVRGPLSQQLVRHVVEFLREHEQLLRPGERLPMSTEILESSFALYKQLERQHSHSGFSSLLLTFPTLLHPTTPDEVAASFARVKVAQVRAWVKEHLPNTLAAQRQLVFREPRRKTRAKTRNRATPLRAAA
jgi:hypothetical protein